MKKSDKKKKASVAGAKTFLIELIDNFGYSLRRQICTDRYVAETLVENFVGTQVGKSGRIRSFDESGKELKLVFLFTSKQSTTFDWQESHTGVL